MVFGKKTTFLRHILQKRANIIQLWFLLPRDAL